MAGHAAWCLVLPSRLALALAWLQGDSALEQLHAQYGQALSL
ncbi:MAG: hypothetical protein V4679_17450 [Pseudomonadota bacterium]